MCNDLAKAMKALDGKKSVDLRGFTSGQVAEHAARTFLELREGLLSRGLEISVKKSGFLVGDAATGRALKLVLSEYDNRPELKDTIKDLGIDNSLARKRRLSVHHARLQKGRDRLKRVRQLPVRSRRKFVNMSASSVALWGHMALGIPPQKLRAWRLNIARTNKWIKGRGSLEVAMQLHASPLEDPYFRLRLEQLKLWLEMVRRCGVIACSALARAWRQSWQELVYARYRWMIVKGPLAATQAVLMDVGWNACEFDVWTDDRGTDWRMDFSDPCLYARLELGFLASLKRRQGIVMSQQFFGHGLQSGLDVVLHKRLLDGVAAQDAPMLEVWWQGSLQHSLNSRQRVCPSCRVELTLVHMLFECPACCQECGPVPETWVPLYRLDDQCHFWLRGLVPSAWTCGPLVSDENIVRTGCFLNPEGCDFACYFYATDGSGGPFSSDPRLRKCAWAVVAVERIGEEYVLSGSVSGYVCDDDNPNTVARAELRAFVELLLSVPDNCDLVVAVDASFVVNVFTQVRRCLKKIRNPHGDLKGQLATLLDKQVRLTKVKSHIPLDEHVAAGGEVWSWHANGFADALASLAAEAVAPHAVAEVNAWIFNRAKRLAAWIIPRIRYWLSVEAAEPKIVPDGPPRTKNELFHQAETKVLEVTFGNAVIMACVVPHASVFFKNTGLCLTWKSGLLDLALVRAKMLVVVILCCVKFILLIPCMVRTQPSPVPIVGGD